MSASSKSSIASENDQRNMTEKLFAILALLVTSGCVSIDAPDDFLVVDQDSREIKMITADEARLWFRELDDDDKGNFEFWSKALENDFVNNRGYTLFESAKVKDSKGLEGLEMIFEMTTHGRTHRYLITMFVEEKATRNVIRVAEFVAEKGKFDGHLDEVREAIRTIRS